MEQDSQAHETPYYKRQEELVSAIRVRSIKLILMRTVAVTIHGGTMGRNDSPTSLE
jgi:hypothetical protein